MSINRSELRDGNILRGQCGNVVYDSMKEPIRSTVEYYCSGMRIDDYWLKKLGFIWYEKAATHTGYGLIKHNKLTLSVYPNDNRFFLNGHFQLRIYFIHQLQNLFFALTGKELTFES